MMTVNTSVLLPMIRRVMPQIIANYITGVQPMTSPAGSIFTMRQRYGNGWYGRVKMSKLHFQHFLRVYNRRTYHNPEYLTNLGYQHVKVSRRDGLNIDAIDWCEDHLKQGSWVHSHADFWFAHDTDAVLFKMSFL